MNANWKKRIPGWMKNSVDEAVAEEYEKIKKQHEKKVGDRIEFMFILGVAIPAHEKLGFGPKRRKELINKIIDTINELSSYLAGNKVMETADHSEHYDIDYNREYLKRLADEYGVPFDEEVFNDEF